MIKAVGEREIVLGILLELEQEGAHSHIVLRAALEKYQYLDKRERAFITRVVEGTLERMIEIDYILDQFSKVKANKMKPVIRWLMRSAVYQLKYMDHVPNSAVCNEAVKLAVKKGFSGLKAFVNGVLRNITRNLENITYPEHKDTVKYFSVKYSMPTWIVKKWLEMYNQEQVESILTDFLKVKPTVIRCNLNRTTKNKLKNRLKDEGIEVSDHPYLDYALRISGYNYLQELESFRSGDFYIQDVSSMLVTEIANPIQGDYVIDVCAAPGGKALHVAEKLNGSGLVEARDLTDYKVSLIVDNIKRAGFRNIKAVRQDATILDLDSVEKADVVIADLPCSGLGVLGKKTDLKYNITEEMQRSLVLLQRQILSVVQQYVKKGKTLIYSTCTLNEEENMGNVRWFLEEFPEFQLSPIVDLPGAAQGCITLLPGIHESDGFFIARFQKAMATSGNPS